MKVNYTMVNFKTINRENNMQQPDAKRHQQISFAKSAVRIVGYLFIPFNISVAVTLLVVSEAIGIIEELV